MTKLSNNAILQNQFRDSLIIDKYDPQIAQWGSRKLHQDRSESIEDALIWNVFRSFKQINPSLWLEPFFKKAFQTDYPYSIEHIEVNLWKKVNPPKNISSPERAYEIDIVIETKEFVWFLIAKYKSDIVVRSRNDQKSNQVIRNIDVGLEYTKNRHFYFSLLYLNTFHTPYGQIITNDYRQSNKAILQDLPYRTTEISRLKDISIVTWNDINNVLKSVYLYSNCKFEKVVASQASQWLYHQIIDD